MKKENLGLICLIACIGIIVGPMFTIIEAAAMRVIGLIIFMTSFVVIVTLKATEHMMDSSASGIKKFLLGIFLYGGAVALSLAIFCFFGWIGVIGAQTEKWRAFYTAGVLPLFLGGGGSCGGSNVLIFVIL